MSVHTRLQESNILLPAALAIYRGICRSPVAARSRVPDLRLAIPNSQFLPEQSRRVLHAMLKPYDRDLLHNAPIPSGRQPMRGIRTKEQRFI